MSSPTVKYTPTQVRDREVALIGTKGLPTPWWSLPAGNDCVGFQLYCLGLRTAGDFAEHNIRISDFLAYYKWVEVPMVSAKAGDLVLEEWPDEGQPITGTPGHMEYIYSIDRSAGKITTIAANTGEFPGKPFPRGAWKKTRDLTANFLIAIRIPYADAKVSKARTAEVKAVAAYLNALHLGRTSAAADDGVEGENYWWLVQTWGRGNGVYPKPYIIDGIPGPHTRAVEKVVAKLAGKA